MKMERMRELTHNFSIQAGPGGTAESVLTDVDLSVAQNIGRQLAEIGDQVNQHYCNNPLNLWPHPLRMAPHIHHLTRNLLYRGVLGHHRGFKSKLAEIRTWQMVRRAERLATWVFHICPSNKSGWAAGLLATALLATVAIYIDF